jgi:hypothetical protein
VDAITEMLVGPSSPQRSEPEIHAYHGGVDPATDSNWLDECEGILRVERLGTEIHVIVFHEDRPIRREQIF